MRRRKRWIWLSQHGNERWGFVKKLRFSALLYIFVLYIYTCYIYVQRDLQVSYHWVIRCSERLNSLHKTTASGNDCARIRPSIFFQERDAVLWVRNTCMGFALNAGNPYLSRSLQHLARGYSCAFPTPHVCSPKELTHSRYKKPYPSRCPQSLHWS